MICFEIAKNFRNRASKDWKMPNFVYDINTRIRGNLVISKGRLIHDNKIFQNLLIVSFITTLKIPSGRVNEFCHTMRV